MRSSANWISRNRCWVSGCAAAIVLASAPLAAHTPPPFTEGLLWRISKIGVPDSFAFGTIHIADPRIGIAKPVEDALVRSRTLALELGNGIADEQVFELEQFRDGRRLQSLIGDEAFKQVRVELAAQDVPLRVIERMKPWAAMIKVARAPARGGVTSLDQQLLAAARARGMRIEPLEWVEEQIAAFDAVPLESQVALLKHALTDREALEAGVEGTIRAWLRGDLARLARLNAGSHDRFSEMGRHYLLLTKHLVHDRNVLMHHRLAMPLRGGRVFIAVGALHLHGEKGLLALIARDGYRVTRLF
ncbi:MAG: TraB/GumN family protein [Burkholderiales bacterium]